LNFDHLLISIGITGQQTLLIRNYRGLSLGLKDLVDIVCYFLMIISVKKQIKP